MIKACTNEHLETNTVKNKMGVSIRNLRGRYYAVFYDEETKQRKDKSLGTSNKRNAETKARVLEEQWIRGEFDPFSTKQLPSLNPLAASSYHEYVKRFLADKKDAGRSSETIRTYEEVLNLLGKEVGKDAPIKGISRKEIVAFCKDDDLAVASRQKRYRHVRAFFKYAKKKKWIAENPIESGIEFNGPKNKLPTYITRDELDAICKQVRKDYKHKRKFGEGQGGCREGEIIWLIPVFRWAFFTGMRISEIARLKWKHIDFRAKVVYIVEQKNNKEETIPLNNAAAEVIADLSGAPEDYVFQHGDDDERSWKAFRNNVNRKFVRYRKAAGIEKESTFHDLRHGFCTYIAEQGKPAHVIQGLARHADIKTSLIYVHLTNEYLKKEANDIF